MGFGFEGERAEQKREGREREEKSTNNLYIYNLVFKKNNVVILDDNRLS